MTDNASISFRSVIPTSVERGVADVYKDHSEWPNLDKYTWFTRQSANIGLTKLMKMWQDSIAQPYYGVTSDGCVRKGLYTLKDEGAPTVEASAAAERLLFLLDEKQRSIAIHDVNSDVWRRWANPEFYAHQYGLRLDETSPEVQQAAMDLLRSSMSEKGFEKAKGCMWTNEFLGLLVGGEKIMNEYSYNLNIFGTPSIVTPWGFNYYGHHLCLNIAFVGHQMTISPTFFGAEPDVIDSGKHKGLRLFRAEEIQGLRLMQSLDKEVQKQAQLYPNMLGEHLPSHRWNPFDERHVAGAFRDNRIIPFEGAPVKVFTVEQKKRVMNCVGYLIEYLPAGPLQRKLKQVEEFIDETYFVWFGGFSDADPYYYRIHSPVIIVEFDFHCGVFLTNKTPAKFHIHTVVRTPNGNDYAKELIRLYVEMKEEEG